MCSHDEYMFFDCVEMFSAEKFDSQFQKRVCGLLAGLQAFETLIKEFAFSGKRTGQIIKEQGNAVHRES